MNQRHGKHILIIDDALDIQMLLRLLLEAKGYHVDCASNGAEALSLLNSSGVLPDVILLDLQMPIMDGLGLLSSQRNTPRLRNIPTVVMSAVGDAESMRIKTKTSNILMKPLSVASVIKAIERNSYLH